MADFGYEAVAKRLFDLISLRYSDMSNPLETYGGRETGADVEIRVDTRPVGIQVTDFCADEGIADPRRGLRATEARNAKQGKFTGHWIPLQNQRDALRLRFDNK
ncbi:MAG: hypothetical protein HY261_04435, partial [Chloroflexi bacterium]|nr:hypothetical protein [Chloroflexota bacterium]